MPTLASRRPARATRILLLLAGACALAACATAPSPPALRSADTAESADAPPLDGASIYGLYLAGETALDEGHSRAAAVYLGQASAQAPDASFIRDRAFAAALVAGEVERAAGLAPTSDAPAPQASASVQNTDRAVYTLGLLTRATVDLSHDQGKAAYALLSDAPEGEHPAAATLLRPWAAAMAGDWKAATAPVDAHKDQAIASFGALGQGLLLERAGRMAQAEAVFKGEASRGGVFALAYGEFLERRGRRVDALALYDEALAKDPADPAFLAAKARVDAQGAPPAAPTLKQGAAKALIGPAALLLAAKAEDAGLAYLRLALQLDPHLDEAWILVGDAMDAAGDPAAARDAYARVLPGGPEYATAQDRLALSLQSSGDKTQALAVARKTADVSPNDPQTLVVLADVLRDDERYDDAVQVLDRLITKVGGDTATSWRLYYLRGASLERAGRWAPAQADLQQALKLQPDNPEVLNYLGFAWADRGEHLDQALGLLQKATALDPQDGAVIDSLGWVHYRLGDYPKAVHELELAISLDPADPEVNDHLGDAYWRTGRRLEARYQWRRVLTLDPDAALRTAAEAKLSTGLAPGAPTASTAR